MIPGNLLWPSRPAQNRPRPRPCCRPLPGPPQRPRPLRPLPGPPQRPRPTLPARSPPQPRRPSRPPPNRRWPRPRYRPAPSPQPPRPSPRQAPSRPLPRPRLRPRSRHTPSPLYNHLSDQARSASGTFLIPSTALARSELHLATTSLGFRQVKMSLCAAHGRRRRSLW